MTVRRPTLRLTPEALAIVDDARNTIRAGSKSFSLASLLFGRETQIASHFLYVWCRYCDDQVDGEQGGREAQLARLAELRRYTAAAYGPEALQSLPPVFQAFRHVSQGYAIPRFYADELLEGMAMDVRGETYPSVRELELYCYRVAGVVGLMMSHIMGVRSARALDAAAQLGMAMQMTNICRDVLTDAELGRVYLPGDWLAAEGVASTPEAVALPVNRAAVAKVVARVLDEAERRYRIGLSGIGELSFRSALAVSAAAGVYRQIGRFVRARGERAWESRTIVPSGWKRWALFLGVLRVLSSVPGRLVRPWSPVILTETWRLK